MAKVGQRAQAVLRGLPQHVLLRWMAPLQPAYACATAIDKVFQEQGIVQPVVGVWRGRRCMDRPHFICCGRADRREGDRPYVRAVSYKSSSCLHHIFGAHGLPCFGCRMNRSGSAVGVGWIRWENAAALSWMMHSGSSARSPFSATSTNWIAARNVVYSQRSRRRLEYQAALQHVSSCVRVHAAASGAGADLRVVCVLLDHDDARVPRRHELLVVHGPELAGLDLVDRAVLIKAVSLAVVDASTAYRCG